MEKALFNIAAKVYVGDTLATVQDIGTIESIAIAVEEETQSISTQYKTATLDFKSSKKASISFDLLNMDWEKIAAMRGTEYYTTVAGTLVSDATQTISDPTADTFYLIENQNGDGSKITVDSVGALVLNTDYFVVPNSEGKWGIVFASDETGDYVVTYDYTPSASKRFEYGGTNASDTIQAKVVKIIGTNDQEETITYTFNYGKVTSGLSFNFPDMNSAEVSKIPFTIECTQDPTNTSLPIFSIDDTMSDNADW